MSRPSCICLACKSPFIQGTLSRRQLLQAASLGFAATIVSGISLAETLAADPDETRIQDVVTASHILANEGILDSYGHVSTRSAKNPAHFFMPRAMTPSQVTRADIVELDLDCKPVMKNSPRLNGERYIHGEIYKARPEIQSVIHSHDLAVIPFGITSIPLRPVVAQAGFLPAETPLFEVRDAYGSTVPRGVLVTNPMLGHALAKKLGANPVILMARHGETVVGTSVREATVRALYTNIDAKAQWAAMAISPNVKSMDAEELAYNARENFDADRPWQNYLDRMLMARASH